MATSAPMTDAIPLMESDGVTGRNSARDYRVGLIGALLAHSATGAIRDGVIPSEWDLPNRFRDFKVIPNNPTTPDNKVRVVDGRAIISRAGQGPYLAFSDVFTTLDTEPAELVNPRIDSVIAQIYDHAAGDSTSGPHGPQLRVIKGAPHATTPVPPTLPGGSIRLTNIARAAGVDTVSAASITDTRKAAHVHGTPRFLLPGDALTDPGYIDGEERVRTLPHVPPGIDPPTLVDRWSGVDNKWHGTQTLCWTGTQTPGTAQNGQTIVLSTFIIPALGYPYRIETSCSTSWAIDVANQANQLCGISTNYDSTDRATNIISEGFELSQSIAAGFTQATVDCSANASPVLDGTTSHTARCFFRNLSSAFWMPVQGGNAWSFRIRAVPA
ncbi:hypothetical protein EV193_104371 [Herbihabitans rhizosphaerae]|uniref:Uncharacterized protein n=1 Tax=Herbihabitans rhizosphaerae TaxID=1872711 RepID=A0A4Q7KRH4_9PSEU|nr:hypothetical protein [Herbihabitans rhizosphaerae]RZS39155.1 hypothetical protein EV193_104371 [Herbihabitans rhizosphaerae]